MSRTKNTLTVYYNFSPKVHSINILKLVFLLFLFLDCSRFTLGLTIKQENGTVSERWGNAGVDNASGFNTSGNHSLRYFGDKNDKEVEYPELIPGRPITVYLIVGVLFVGLTVLPYILISVYIILTPSNNRFRWSGRRRMSRSLPFLRDSPFAAEPDSYDPSIWSQSSNSIVRAPGSECLERIICRVSRRARKYGMGNLMQSVLESMTVFPVEWKSRLERGIWSLNSMYDGSGDCGNFYCQPFNSILSDWSNWTGSTENSVGHLHYQNINQLHSFDSIHPHNNYYHDSILS